MSSTGPSEPIPTADIRAAVDDILATEEFRPGAYERWMRELSTAIGDFLEDLFGGAEGLPAFDLRVVAFLIVAVLAAFVLAYVARHLPGRAGRVAARPSATVVDRVEELLARARAAGAAGDRLLALRLYFFALVVGLGERGELEYRDAWTNRELLERGASSAALVRRLAPIVRDLDRKSFGGEAVAAADVDDMRALCERHLRPVGGRA